MKRAGLFIAIFVTLAAGFTAGDWYAQRKRGAVENPTSGRKILYWVDPMHPGYKSDKPGIAPDCGMQLEPVYADSGSAHAAHGKMSHAPAGTFHVSPERQQLIGVKFATAEISAGMDDVRAVGKIAQDETKITRIHPKIEGWIEKVYVDFTGQPVKQGDPLISIYSPEMLASEQEFLLALRARDEMKGGPSQEAYENSEILIEAARRRLELWDLRPEQIAELERTRKPVRTVTLYSPAAGYVISRNAFPSQRVSPDTELYAIADLSRVWIMADVFEADLSKIHAGQIATISLPNGEIRPFEAKVSYIQPEVDPATRTLQVRLEAPNPGLRLKPGMFVNVDFRIALPARVTVPADAVLNTGLRKTVFVDHGEGNLERRAVETGDRIGDRVQILSGLRAGERVVASGVFLIDSEAQLRHPDIAAAAPAGGEHVHD